MLVLALYNQNGNPLLQPVKSSQIIQQNETEIHPLEKKMKTYVRKIKAHIAK